MMQQDLTAAGVDTPNGLFTVGTRVRKAKGYPFPGVIATIFRVPEGPSKAQWRAVVCCTEPACVGMLHIYNLEQLEVA